MLCLIQITDVPPDTEDTAIIMYTSGSTGTPKVTIRDSILCLKSKKRTSVSVQ